MKTALLATGIISSLSSFYLNPNYLKLAYVVQANKFPETALSKIPCRYYGIGFGVESISAPLSQFQEAQDVLIRDCQHHNYCMVLSLSKGIWIAYDLGKPNPKINYLFSEAFMKELTIELMFQICTALHLTNGQVIRSYNPRLIWSHT